MLNIYVTTSNGDKMNNLNDVDTWKKRGIGVYKRSWEIEGFNPKKQEKTVSTRSEVYVDYELDIFNQEFFDNLNRII